MLLLHALAPLLHAVWGSSWTDYALDTFPKPVWENICEAVVLGRAWVRVCIVCCRVVFTR
jgi:hypothetical protein